MRIAVVSLIIGLPLAAQETDTTRRERTGRFGVGVSLNATAGFFDEDLALLPLGFTNILFPIRGKGVIVEPEFGFFRFSRSSGGSAGSSSSDFNNLRVGVGMLALLREREQLQPYLGPRLGISRVSRTERGSFGGGTQTFKNTNWYISGVLGAQHFFTRHFSLGGEIQLTRISVGEEEVTPPPPSSFSESQSFVTTAAVVTLRWFF